MADKEEPKINPLETASIEDLLGELTRRLGASPTPEAQTLAHAIRSYSVTLSLPSDETQLDNPEDEFVQSIKGFAIEGKFPQGLSAKGREFTPPHVWNEEFMVFSDINLIPWFQKRVDIIRESMQALYVPNYRFKDQVKPLKDKHFLAVVPYVPSKDELQRLQGFETDHSLLIFSTLQDYSIKDMAGRNVGFVHTYFLMPTDKAQTFITLIKQRVDGADIAERLLQKAAPGAMASKQGESGVARVQASELIILDDTFQNSTFLQNPVEHSKIQEVFLNNIAQAPRKPYSQPVGFGTPPS